MIGDCSTCGETACDCNDTAALIVAVDKDIARTTGIKSVPFGNPIPEIPTEGMCDEARGFILGLDLNIRDWQGMEKHLDRGGYSCTPYIREMAAKGQGRHITKWDVAHCIWQLMARAIPVPAPVYEPANAVQPNDWTKFEKKYFMEWIEKLSPGALARGRNAAKPVSVSLEKCALALRVVPAWGGEEDRYYDSHERAAMQAKAVLEAAKEQGVRLDYVD